LHIIRVYAQSVPSIHRHNGLDATPLAESKLNHQVAFTCRLTKF